MPRSFDRAARLDDIADAVERIAIRDGFGAVTFRRVADRLDASTTVVTHVFDTRERLLDEVIDRAIARRRAEIDARIGESTGAPALRTLLEWAVLALDEDAHRFWLALVAGAESEPVVRRRLDGFNRWWDDLVAVHAAELVGSDDVGPDVDTVIDVVDVIVAGIVVAGVETDTVWNVERRRAVLEHLVAPLGI